MEPDTLPLRLAALPAGHSTHRGRLRLEALDAAEEPEPIDLEVTIEVDHVGSHLHLRGAATGTAQSTCHRCLERFERPVQAEFALTLQKGVTAADSEDIVAVPETLAAYDVAPHVREAVLLEEPIRILCRSDCRGLCPQCGADLNAGACGCKPVADPRWAALEGLRPSEDAERTDWRSKHGPTEA